MYFSKYVLSGFEMQKHIQYRFGLDSILEIMTIIIISILNFPEQHIHEWLKYDLAIYIYRLGELIF